MPRDLRVDVLLVFGLVGADSARICFMPMMRPISRISPVVKVAPQPVNDVLNGGFVSPMRRHPAIWRPPAVACQEDRPMSRTLSPRHDRLRPQPARPEMAGRRPRRGAVRRQLRGGRREQHPPRRRRLGGVPVGDRRRAALAGHAPHEHGVDLRIRLARRLLAPVADVHRARRAGRPSMASRPRSPATRRRSPP